MGGVLKGSRALTIRSLDTSDRKLGQLPDSYEVETCLSGFGGLVFTGHKSKTGGSGLFLELLVWGLGFGVFGFAV